MTCLLAANESVEKALARLLGTDQAAMRMRDVIQQLWGAMVEHAKNKSPRDIRKNRLELKKSKDRATVASYLSPEEQRRACPPCFLDDLYTLYQHLSPDSKDILSQDDKKL